MAMNFSMAQRAENPDLLQATIDQGRIAAQLRQAEMAQKQGYISSGLTLAQAAPEGAWANLGNAMVGGEAAAAGAGTAGAGTAGAGTAGVAEGATAATAADAAAAATAAEAAGAGAGAAGAGAAGAGAAGAGAAGAGAAGTGVGGALAALGPVGWAALAALALGAAT